MSGAGEPGVIVALIGAEFEENLAIRYLWGALERAGHQVVHIVFNEASAMDEVARELAESDAAIAGLSMVFTARAKEFAAVATRAREYGFAGHIVAGGHFAAFHPEQLLADVPAIDSVICGEGEQPLCELAEALPAIHEVPGVVWRDGQRIVRNPSAVKPPDLETLAPPPRKQPLDRYLDLPVTNMLSSRGCSHGCSFCSITAWHALCGGDRVRYRAPAAVATEMAQLYHQGVRIFNFHDDNFLMDSPAQSAQRVQALGQELAARDVGRIAFAIKARPDAVDEPLLRQLQRLGLFRVFLGIEAGTHESLARLGRGQKLADNRRALELVNRLGLHACFNLLLLNPESTLEDVQGNVTFLRAHPDNPMNFCRTEIYAGTPLERRLNLQGRLLGDYWGYSYRILDPRAQLAFEVLYPVFERRNYGAAGLHHLAMDVDYELQLLLHFRAAQAAQSGDLHTRAKQWVRAVNANTCDHLDAILSAIGDEPATEATRAALICAHKPAVQADNQRLAVAGRALVDEIRAAAVAPTTETLGVTRGTRRRWANAAAAASLAATLAVPGAGCGRDKSDSDKGNSPTTGAARRSGNSHPTEQIARPPDAAPQPDPPIQPPPDTRAFEMVAMPPDASVDPLLAPSDPGFIKVSSRQQVKRLVARHVGTDRKVVLDLTVDGTGAIVVAQVTEPELPKARRDKVHQLLREISFEGQAATYNKRFVLRFTPGQLQRALPPDTRRHEMAPRPIDPEE